MRLSFIFPCTYFCKTNNISLHYTGLGENQQALLNGIGFNRIPDPLFRQPAILRISHPASKLKSYEYIRPYHHYDMSVWKIYRYMDKLHREHKEEIQWISYRHTQKVLGGEIQIVFYDVTTLYFETDYSDDLRKRGFSKEGKHKNPQILLGLLVSLEAYPLAYDIFEGNKYEGHTMLPIIESFKQNTGWRNRLSLLIRV